jgi:hypothetical protein
MVVGVVVVGLVGALVVTAASVVEPFVSVGDVGEVGVEGAGGAVDAPTDVVVMIDAEDGPAGAVAPSSEQPAASATTATRPRTGFVGRLIR